MKKISATVRNYWLALAAMYGIALSIVATAEWPWPLIMMVAFTLFIVLHALRYGQVGRNVQKKLATANPGVGIVGSVFGGAAVLMRGTDIAYWAGPTLGLITFVGMFIYLYRFGNFHQGSSQKTI